MALPQNVFCKEGDVVDTHLQKGNDGDSEPSSLHTDSVFYFTRCLATRHYHGITSALIISSRSRLMTG